MNLALQHNVQYCPFPNISNRTFQLSWAASTCSMTQNSVHNFQSVERKTSWTDGSSSVKADWKSRESKNFREETHVQISAANLPAVRPWAGCSSSLNHSFLICEMGLILPTHGSYVRRLAPDSTCVEWCSGYSCHWWRRW